MPGDEFARMLDSSIDSGEVPVLEFAASRETSGAESACSADPIARMIARWKR
jgi:hypothetical protein